MGILESIFKLPELIKASSVNDLKDTLVSMIKFIHHLHKRTIKKQFECAACQFFLIANSKMRFIFCLEYLMQVVYLKQFSDAKMVCTTNLIFNRILASNQV